MESPQPLRKSAAVVLDTLINEFFTGSNDESQISAFVSKATESLSLETLRSATASKLEDTRAELVSSINRDYEAFVRLSSALEETDAAVLELRPPVAKAEAAFSDLSKELLQRSAAAESRSLKKRIAQSASAAIGGLLTARESFREAERDADAAEKAMTRYSAFLSGIPDSVATTTTTTSSTTSTPLSLPSSSSTSSVIEIDAMAEAIISGRTNSSSSSSSGNDSLEDLVMMISLLDEEENQGKKEHKTTALSSNSSQSSLLEIASQSLLSASIRVSSATETLISANRLAVIARTLSSSISSQNGINDSSNSTSLSLSTSSSSTAISTSVSETSSLSTPVTEQRHFSALSRSIKALIVSRLVPLIKDITSACLRSSSTSTMMMSTPSLNLNLSPLALHACLLSSSLLGDIGLKAAEDAIISTYTNPLLDTLLSQSRLDEGGGRGGFKGVTRVFKSLEAELGLPSSSSSETSSSSSTTTTAGSQAQVLKRLIDASARVPNFDVISRCFWAPIVARLVSLPAFFSPAIPSTFHANFSACQSLYKSTKAACATIVLDKSPHLLAKTAEETDQDHEDKEEENIELRLIQVVERKSLLTSFGDLIANLDAVVVDGASQSQSSQSVQNQSSTGGTSAVLIMSSPDNQKTQAFSSAAESLSRHSSTTSLAAMWRPKMSLYSQIRSAELSQRIESALKSPGSRLALQVYPLSSALILGETLTLAPTTTASSSTVVTPLPLPLVSDWTTENVSKLIDILSPLHSVPSTVNGGRHALRLLSSVSTWAALTSVWAPGVYLDGILGATILQSLQVLNRYAVWLASGAVILSQRSGNTDLVTRLSSSSSSSSSSTQQDASSTFMVQPSSSNTVVSDLPALSPVITRLLTPAAISAAIAAAATAAAASTSTIATPPQSSSSSSLSLSSSSLSLIYSDLTLWAETFAIVSPTAALQQQQQLTHVTGTEALLSAARDALVLSDCAMLLICSRVLNAAKVPVSIIKYTIKELTEQASCAENHTTSVALSTVQAATGSAAALRSLIPYVLASIHSSFLKQNASVCQLVKGVPAALRMSSSSSQTRSASPYVSSLLRPIIQLLSSGGTAMASSSSSDPLYSHLPKFSAGVVAAILSDYAASLSSVLESLQKTEASLQWLKTSSSSLSASGISNSGATLGATGSGIVSDASAVGTQLAIDVTALGRAIADAPLGPILGLQWDARANKGVGSLSPLGEDDEGEESRLVRSQFLRLELLVRPFN
jgi:trimeric autotransporter adhesin